MQIEELKAARVNVERFVAISDKFTDLQELNAEILRTFISNIVIHERTNKLTKISEQHIYIYIFTLYWMPWKTNAKQAV